MGEKIIFFQEYQVNEFINPKSLQNIIPSVLNKFLYWSRQYVISPN